MDFEEFYGDRILTMQDAVKHMSEKTYLFDLADLIKSGRTLSDEDCSLFWKLFRQALKDAFDTGKGTKNEKRF